MTIMERPFKTDKELEDELRSLSRFKFDNPELMMALVKGIISLVNEVRTIKKTITGLQDSVDSLTNQVKTTVETNLWKTSDENVKLLRKLFGLPEIKEVRGDVLKKMKGMLKEYSKGETDSVELVHQARDRGE